MSFKGDLSTIGLAEVFQMISMSQKEGTLVVQDAESRKAIYFGKEGVQLLSSGKRKGFRIGDLLVRAGKISVGQLREVLEKQEQTKKLLGEELIDAGIVTQEDIEEVVRSQIEEEIYDLFLWKKAAFEFIEGPPVDELRDPDSRAIRLALDVNGLLLEAVRRTDEWSIINQKIPSMDCVYAFISDAARAEAEGTAHDVARAVYANIDGQATVNDVIEASLVPRFEVCKVLVTVLDAGHIRLLSATETAAVAKQRLEEGRREKGFRLFQVAALLAPEDPDLIGTYAHALETEGMIQDAARMYVKVGNLLKAQGSGKDALAYFQRAVSLNPDDAQSKVALFEINIASGNVEEALQTAAEVIGNALKEKDYANGRILAEQAVAAAPQSAEMRLLLARVYNGLELKTERDEVVTYLRKNLPVDQAAADRILTEIRGMTEQVREQPRLISTQSRRRPERGALKRALIVVLIVLIVVVVAVLGILAKYEFDASGDYVKIKTQAINLEHAGNWTGARVKLETFETQYPYSILTLGKMRDDLKLLARREADARKKIIDTNIKPIPTTSEPPVDTEEEQQRKAAMARMEQLLSQMVQAVARAEHEEAVVLAKQLGDLAKVWKQPVYIAKAAQVENELLDFLSKADAKFEEAQGYEKKGQYKEAAETIHTLKAIYFSTKVAQNASYPLCIRVKPKKVQVWKDEKPLFEIEGEKVIHIGPADKFTLRFSKASFNDVSAQVTSPLTGIVVAVLEEKQAQWRLATNERFTAAPDVLAGRIYVAGEKAVYGFNNQQKQVWQQGTGLQPNIGTAPRFRPNGTMYLGSSNKLHCLDPNRQSDDSISWTFVAEALVCSPVAFSAAGSVAFFGCEDSKLYVVNLDADPAVAMMWKLPLPKPVKAEPVESKGTIYVACTDGFLYAFKLGDAGLEEQWKFNAGGSIEAAPYLAGSVLYVASTNRSVSAVDAGSGELLWQAMVGGEVRATPVMAGSTLFVACRDSSLYAFDTAPTATRRELWKFASRGALTSSPLVVGSQVLFGSEDGSFYCVDAAKGEQEWRFQTRGPIRKSPAKGDGVVFFGSDDKNLYCVPIDAE